MMRLMRRRRPPDKRKFGAKSRSRLPADAAVKVKPKEQQPCRTRNAQPKIRAG